MWALLLLLMMGAEHRKLVIYEKYERAINIAPFSVKNREFYFYNGLAHSQLSNKKEAKNCLKNYITWFGKEPPDSIHLLIAENLLENLEKNDKMLNIAADMKNSGRKLNIGRSKEDTQEVQRRIIKSLDEEIKAIEDEMAKASQSASAGSSKVQLPASDSKIMTGEGKGEVANKTLVPGGRFGELPPKEKTKAIQELSRSLPPHVREASEGFSKKLQNGGK